MVSWVERIGQKESDLRAELLKLRQKYERTEQRPEEFPKGFEESGFTQFESLFPEFRERDKTKRPEVSPGMAARQPFPFRQGVVKVPTVGEDILREAQQARRPTPSMVSDRVTVPLIQRTKPVPLIRKTAPTPLIEAEEDIPLKVGVFGKALTKVPRQIASSILQATQGQGGASVVDRDWADRFVRDAQIDLDKFIAETTEKDKESRSPIKLTDIAQLPQNIAFSITSMGAGLGVGIPIGLIPLPGARVAAWGTGSAASGAVAYSMTTYQIMQEYLEAKNEQSLAEKGRGITAEEERQLKADFDGKARAYGLWEAVPEAISNLAFAKLLTTPLTKMVGKHIATRIASKSVAYMERNH